MNTFFKYLSIVILTVGLMGCQGDDSSKQTQNQNQQQQQDQQMPQQQNPMGQAPQQAPDIEVSDEEAETFVDAAMNVQEIQMQNQETMVGIIEDEGLDVETFRKIAQALQSGQSTEDVSESDMDKFESANEAIRESQGEVQQKIPAAIKDAGMEVERFQKISMAAQQDPELSKLIQEKIQKRMGDEGVQGQ